MIITKKKKKKIGETCTRRIKEKSYENFIKNKSLNELNSKGVGVIGR